MPAAYASTDSTVTAVQEGVYRLIVRRCLDGVGCGVRDVQAHFGWLSPNAPARHLLALERAGRIVWERNQVRGLRPAVPQWEAVPVPGGVRLATTGPVVVPLAALPHAPAA